MAAMIEWGVPFIILAFRRVLIHTSAESTLKQAPQQTSTRQSKWCYVTKVWTQEEEGLGFHLGQGQTLKSRFFFGLQSV